MNGKESSVSLPETKETLQPAAFSVVLFAINEPGADVLEALLERGFDVRLLFTRPSGIETDHLPHLIAEREGVPFQFLEKFDQEAVAKIKETDPDFIVTGWYHLKVPPEVIGLSNLASVNFHPSLLPAYRGATPVEWCIMNGEETTGLTLHHLEEKFDTGDILWQQEVRIDVTETAGELLEKIRELIPAAIDELLTRGQSRDFTGRAQDLERASSFPKRTPEHGRLDWTWAGRKILDRVRGLNPWPLAFFEWAGQVHRVASGQLTNLVKKGAGPGTIMEVSDDGQSAAVVCDQGQVVRLFGISPPLTEKGLKSEEQLE